MSKENADKLSVENINNIQNIENKQIYNIKDEKMPFNLQYKQLIAYLQFRNEINKYISGWSLIENTENKTQISQDIKYNKITQDNYCLINKEWIRKWRKHVGYEEIKNYFEKIGNNNNIDEKKHYDNIIKIIEINSKDNLLYPLNNDGIYMNNEVIPDADFELINEKCYKLFTIGSQKTMDINNYKILPSYFLPERYIVLLNESYFWIVFKEKTNQIKFEIMVKFKEMNENTKNIITDFTHKDINDWVTEIGFNLLSEFEKEIEIYNCKILIINKTLKLKVKNSILGNIFDPNFLSKGNDLLNATTIISKQSINILQSRTFYNLKGFNSTKVLIDNNIDKIKLNNKHNLNNSNNKDNKMENDNLNQNNDIKDNNMENYNLNNNNNNKGRNIDNNGENVTLDQNNQNNNVNNSINNNNNSEDSKNKNNIQNNKNINNMNKIIDKVNNSEISRKTEIDSKAFIDQKRNKNNNDYKKDKELEIFNSKKNEVDKINNINNNKQDLNSNNDNIYKNNFNNNELNNNGYNSLNNNYNINNNNQIININNQQQNLNNQFQTNNFQNIQTNNSSSMRMYNYNSNNNIFTNPQFNNNICNNNYNMVRYQTMPLPQSNNYIQWFNSIQNNNNFQQMNFSFNPNDYLLFMQKFQYFFQQSLILNNMNNFFPINISNNYNNNSNNNRIFKNNNMNNNLISNYKNINLNIIYPHKSGLENIGQTCYMNATIQCLSNLKPITNYFLSNYGNFNFQTQTLTATYSNLLFQLFMSNKSYITPKDFKNIIGEMNPLFKGMHAADAKDLVFFIIETLHKENNLLKNNKDNNINSQNDANRLEIESRDENKMLTNFRNDYNIKNKSIICDIFYGINRAVMKCCGCNIPKYSFQTFNLQIFQLKKAKEDKIKDITNEFYNGLNLYDTFYYQQKEEFLTGENMIYCNQCGQLQNAYHRQSIYELPYVLIIILNRGRNNQDFNEEFSFPEILDFKEQNIVLNKNSSYQKFYLCGIIKHLGESGTSGHFIAYCRNDYKDKFMCYNDSVFTEVSIEEAMSAKISDKEDEKKTPYILFYHFLE